MHRACCILGVLLAAPATAQPEAEAAPRELVEEPLRRYLERIDLPKYALAVGIKDYDQFPPVPNAVEDVRLVKSTLEKPELGFSVDTLINADYHQLLDRIDEFAARAVSAEAPVKSVVVFYFAGHGFSSGQSNLLVPADADPRSLFDDSIALGHIVEKLASRKVALTIFLMDSCRNQFFTDAGDAGIQPFLRPSIEIDAEIFFGFASRFGHFSFSFASPQDVNSPFSLALSEVLASDHRELLPVFGEIKRNVKARTVQRQIPQELPVLTGSYYLRPTREHEDDQKGKLAVALIEGSVCEYVSEDPAGPYSTGARAWLLHHPESIVEGHCSP